jgi:hypothetical protein
MLLDKTPLAEGDGTWAMLFDFRVGSLDSFAIISFIFPSLFSLVS